MAEVESRMPESEVIEWCVRSETMPLWPRRLELMMAQVAQMVAQVGARQAISLREFVLFRDRGDVTTNSAEENAGILSAIAGGTGIRKLGQGRRNKKAVH